MACRRYTNTELRAMIYAALTNPLRHACVIDSDDPEFHDQLYQVQLEMADEFEKRGVKAPPVPN